MVSCFFAKKLDISRMNPHSGSMKRRREPNGSEPVVQAIRRRIAADGERIWRFSDFPNAPVAAVAQALSRLARDGTLQRLSKGVYYRARTTALGPSSPDPVAIRRLAADRAAMFPAGVAAANLLGFTTQAGRSEVSTTAGSLPRKLAGRDTVVHTRRPEAWKRLSQHDAALFDFLRHGGRTSELSEEDTTNRTLRLLREPGRYERLVRVASSEPPRVRAILGAIGDEIGKSPATLRHLRATLNPLSRFDFGVFAGLPAARRWHARGRART
jgi:hypothetical protein